MENFELGGIAEFFNQFKAIFKCREKCVAVHLAFDEGEKKIGAERQRLRLDLTAAADENFARFIGQIDLAQVGDGAHSRK